MSGIIGPITPGKVAVALATIGAGATIGGVVANERDSDVATGALIGGASALAGLALLVGGHALWRRFASGSGAAAGASQLGAAVTRSTIAPTPALTTSFTSQVRSTAARLLEDAAAATRASLHAPSVAVPAIAATPALPVAASSGATFLSTLTQFVR